MFYKKTHKGIPLYDRSIQVSSLNWKPVFYFLFILFLLFMFFAVVNLQIKNAKAGSGIQITFAFKTNPNNRLIIHYLHFNKIAMIIKFMKVE